MRGASIFAFRPLPIMRGAAVTRAALTLMLSAVLAGCASAPTEKFYALADVAAAERPAARNSASGLAIVVETATVPELVDRPQLVVSIGESRVSILEQQRWAEPLKTQIARTVALNLARRLGSARVSASPQVGGSDADCRVGLDVQRFESRPGDGVVIEMLWTVRRGAAAEVKSGRLVAREKIGAEGYDALVAAHSRALATISGEIAAAIRE